MNPIPLSLDQPFLRDAIVEFRFQSLINEGLLGGLFYGQLQSLGWEIPAGSPRQSIKLGFDFLANSTSPPFLKKDGFRLQVLPESLSFNITDTYPGWSKVYKPLIEAAMRQIDSSGVVQLTRVGLRFINILPIADIFEIVDRFQGVELSGFVSKGHAVTWKVAREDIQITMNLASKVAINHEETNSILDVDLTKELKESNQNLESALELIDQFHALNKEIVFGQLLPESFIAGFGPKFK